jgi:hypothetical protein
MSPFDAGRDGSTGGYGVDAQSDIPDGHVGAMDAAFDAQLPGDPRPGEAEPGAGRFTYPYLRGPGGRLADD